MSSAKPGAELRPSIFKRWVENHGREIRFTLGRFRHNLAGALLTCLVIGTTLALPAALHCVVRNVQAVSYSWESSLQASLFLKNTVTTEQGQALAEQLRRRPGVKGTSFITREQSLQEFRRLSGFGQALDMLDDNPLPAVISVMPATGLDRPAVDRLLADLSHLPQVEVAKLDREWLERLYALLALAQRLVLIIAGVLALAVIVIVGNTIRLDIEARRAEIEVLKLIGANDAFIRRPFLYTGLWYGLIGGVIAWLVIQAALVGVAGPARELAGLYGSSYQVQGLSFTATALMFAAGIGLGWLGALWTVGRHIRSIEPK